MQMMDSYKIVATEAFKSAVKDADEQKESAFKEATEALSGSMVNISQLSNQRKRTLKERLVLVKRSTM